MDVFSLFESNDYTFLKLGQGGIKGNTIIYSTPAQGILKLRDGMVLNNARDTITSDATLHIKPSETFVTELGNLIGHGIKSSKNGIEQAYRIIGQVEGYNFETNALEFVKVALKREKLI